MDSGSLRDAEPLSAQWEARTAARFSAKTAGRPVTLRSVQRNHTHPRAGYSRRQRTSCAQTLLFPPSNHSDWRFLFLYLYIYIITSAAPTRTRTSVVHSLLFLGFPTMPVSVLHRINKFELFHPLGSFSSSGPNGCE